MEKEQAMRNIKAILMDYTGTIIKEGGPEIEELIARVYRNSDFNTPGEAIHFWYSNLAELEKKSYGSMFLTEDEICLRLLDLCEKEHRLSDNHEELHLLNQRFWRNGPVFNDAAAFLKKCTLPVYVLTNNASAYVEENLTKRGIHPAGIVSAEDVRAFKPHREIFERALNIAGVSAEEVTHIGDSYQSDILGAKKIGIEAVLVDREGKAGQVDCRVVRSLTEILALCETGIQSQ